MELELVILAPVLVLLTLFVLWAARGGRAGLTADLAAEEAATAAAYCCEEETAGDAGREALAEDFLEARPGLEFLCVGGLRPDAEPDTLGGPRQFVRDEWVEFEPGRVTGGVGVLGVQFLCETDGAVAPLRGLFPTVTFHGQAAEVVLREAVVVVGFKETLVEVTEGTDTHLVFEVRSPVLPDDVILDYEVVLADTTAQETDFTGVPDFANLAGAILTGQVTIVAGLDSAEISVPLVDDAFYEDVESLFLEITSALQDIPGNPTPLPLGADHTVAQGRITDNDPKPHVFLHSNTDPCQVVEGGAVTFEVRLRDQANTGYAPSAAVVTVDVGTADVTATAGTDYTVWDTTETFAPGTPGETVKSVTVQTIDDAAAPVGEPTETFTLVLSNAGGAPLEGTVEVTCEILDDEVRVTVADVGVDEGDQLTFKLSLDRALAADIKVDYSLVDHNRATRPAQRGAAPCDSTDDYLELTGTITVPFGHSHLQTVDLPAVTTCDDALVEFDETFWVEISIPRCNPPRPGCMDGGEAVVDAGEGAVGTIRNDDIPVVSIVADPADATGTEGQATLKFTVALTVDGQPAQLQPGQDVTVEYEIGGAGATATAPGASDADYAATLDTATPQELSGSTLGGMLTFTAGPPAVTEHVFEAELLADDLLEGPVPETFVVDLDNLIDPVGAAVFEDTDSDPLTDDSQVEATIVDEAAPYLFVGNAEAREGETLTFTITLCNPVVGEDVTVKYETLARSAAAGRDFVAVPKQTLSFLDSMLPREVIQGCGAGVTADAKSHTVYVETRRDTIEESDEEVHLLLSEQTPDGQIAFGKSVGVGRIINVSAATVRVSDPTAVEGATLLFVISLVDNKNRPATITAPVRVYYGTVDGTATEPGDYTRVPRYPHPRQCLNDAPPPPQCPSVTFNDSDNTRSYLVSVQTTTDTADEDDETVALVLRLAAGNAGLGDTEGTGTIIDADPPALTISDATALEGETMTFTVALSRPTSEAVTVLAATEDGIAAEPGDYTAASRRLRIAAGATEASFDVEINSDGDIEPSETFRVVLSDATNALIGRAAAIGTITEDCWRFDSGDPGAPAPVITAFDSSVQEGSDRPPNFYFSLSTPLCDSEQMTLTKVFNRTATATDSERTQLSVTWSVAPVLSLRPVGHYWGVSAIDDALDEDDEQYEVHVSWARLELQGRAVGVGVVTIFDNDPEPSLRIADASAVEGDDLRFAVSLDAPSGRAVNAQYRTVQRTGADAATEVDDYVPASAWTDLAFTPTIQPTTLGGSDTAGQTEATVVVPTVSDGVAEGDETLLVELREPPDASTPMNARLDDSVAVGTILAGSGPSLSIFDAAADEGETMRLRVELSAAQTQPVTVNYSTVERTGPTAAGEGPDGDYVRAAGMLDFAAGFTEAFVDVAVNSDDVDEGDETFLVELSGQSPAGVSLADPSAVGTITGSVACADHAVAGTVLPLPTVRPGRAGEGAGRLPFTIVVDPPLCYPARVTVSGASGGTAVWDVDVYDGCEAILPSWHTEVTCAFIVIDDDLVEGDETVMVRPAYTLGGGASGVPYASVAGVDALAGTIVDDDLATVTVADTSGSEGGFLNFVIRIDRRADRTVTVDYATEDTTPLSAAAGVDYRPQSDTAQIAAGELSATVAVFAPEDRLDEADETFVLRLSNPTGGATLAAADAVAVGRILDDDAPPVARVSDASAEEGGTLEFAVTLDAPSGREVRIPRVTRDGTARAADGDYVALASGDVVFAAGATRQSVGVQTLTDSAFESPESVVLLLRPPSDNTATVGQRIGRGTIRDVSDRRVRVSDASVIEGGTLAFEVAFAEGPSSRDVTLRYRTRAGTATAGDDYDDDFESAPRELKIVAGDTSATVYVPTVRDRLDEDIESLELVLSNPQGAVIVDGTAAGTIIDDDPEPALSVSDTAASEADGASATFTLSLSAPSGRDVTVTYSTADATAVAGDDYTAATDAVQTIKAGASSATVDVALVNDDDAEAVETFQLVVTGADNAGRDDSVGVATITDDDGLVQILVDDPDAVYEGDGASAVFTVRLSRADATNPVTVMYSTADGTAVAASDYTAATSQTLTFAAGETTKTVTVALINDETVEVSETFRLVLSSPSSNAELGDDTATVLVLDDDGLPTLSVADAATRTEGSTASFTATLSRATTQDVTVAYATLVDPTAANEAAATPGQDYTAASATLTIAARATQATVTVPLLGDSLDEHTETFWLRLHSPTGATIVDGTATGTITDDDPLPELTIVDAAATEGSPLSFEVRLDAASGRTVTVPWATEALPAAAGAASPGDDYTTASGTVTFAPGETTARVEVASLPDDVSEPDERFLVQLGTPTNAALDDGAAVGAIRDDDGLPRVSIADTTVDEDAGPAIFTVTLSHPSSQPVTVRYNTADGTGDSTATDPDDYAPDLVRTRTLTVPATFTGGEISVFVADDDIKEGTETFTITLTNPQNAVIAEGAGTAVGTILDDDGEPQISVSDAEECEDGSSTADCEVRACRMGAYSTPEQRLACEMLLATAGVCQPGMCSGDGTIEFPVQLSHASTDDTSVRYTTFAAGGATSPGDYIATTATLTIPAGDTAAAIPVVLVDNGVTEATETFRLRLDNPVGVEVEVAEAIGTILDDDPQPWVAAEAFDAFYNEDDGTAYHRVRLSHPSDLTVTVDYRFVAVIDRSGNAGIDPTPGTLTFAPGVVEQTIEVPLFDNDVATYALRSYPYSNTTYRIQMNNRVNARYGLSDATGVVWDDETPPYVDRVSVQDTLEGAGAAIFTITLNRFSDTAVTATYQTDGGTARPGSDYTAAVATVTFPPGTITATVDVPIINDTAVESNESFTLRIINDARNSNLTYLAGPLLRGRGSGSGSVVIIDDDTTPEISVADTRANENAGTMAFWVSLSRASATDVTVGYATADGTATAGADYTATAGTLTIPAGATGAWVSVAISDDTDDTESDETFDLDLSNVTGATITDAGATATIIEDANLLTITMADASRSENIQVTSRFIIFVASLGEPATRRIQVDYQVVELPLGDEAATIGADFISSLTGGTITIPSGQPSGFFHLEIIADDIPERDERFQVILRNPRGATLGTTRAWGTILNDDVPIVSVADAQASEFDDAVVFTLQLHEPGLDPASLHYTAAVRTSEGDSAASPGDDYTAVSGTLNIPAGDTTATISVPIIADTADEFDETFLLVLSNPDTLEFRDPVAVGTITDDDDGFWIDDDRSVGEDAATMDFTVRRDHTSAADVTVEYRIGAGGSAVGGTACTVDGADFVTPTGTVTMPAAGTEATISVEICDDDDLEGRENLLIELTNVTGRKTTGVGTIVDNDSGS